MANIKPEKRFTILVIDDVREQRDSLVSELRNEFEEAFVVSVNSAQNAKTVLESKEELKSRIIINTAVDKMLTKRIEDARVAFKPFLKELYPSGYKTLDIYKNIQDDETGDIIEMDFKKYYSDLAYEKFKLEENVRTIKELLKERSELDNSLLYNQYKDFIETHPKCLNIACVIVDMIDDRIRNNKRRRYMGLEVFDNIEALKKTNPDFKDTQVIFYTGQMGQMIDFNSELLERYGNHPWKSENSGHIELDIMKNLKTLILTKNIQDGQQLIRHVYQSIWSIEKK